MARPAGSPNRGYFYRAGRGWYANLGDRMIPLRDEDGNHYRDKNTPHTKLKLACFKIIAEPAEVVNSHDDTNTAEVQCAATVQDVCIAYLNKVYADGDMKTWRDRGDTLIDLCLGYPPASCNKDKFCVKDDAKKSDRIHKGYGTLAVAKLLPLDIDRWLASHKNWNGCKRTRIQAVKRAFNYGVECGLISKSLGSPLRGFKVPRAIPRITYITPEQEEAMYKIVNPAFAMAVKICIRTGARPGKEFAKLTAKHVTDHGNRMEWTFAVREHKTGKATGKKRVIRITDPEIMRIVREQIEKYPTGPIFRNTRGTEQTRKNLELSFRIAKRRLAKKGIRLDDDACMYSCRHTYAKRTLQGYWTDKMTNIETLARLMGNSPQTCREHYLQWTETYEEPLWECA
jgi:integrase